jgi:DNA polymerase-3 subunit delta'
MTTSAPLGTGFDRLVGQDQAAARLQRAAERPVHAYLLVGPKGAELVLAARAFGAALVAPPGDERAVDLALRGGHPDVVEFEPETTVLSVRQAREEIIPEAWRSPVEPTSRRKALLVFEPERLSDDAQGALLKTLEEPPADTVIVLATSAPDDLLETTRSRCQRIELAPLDETTIAASLEYDGLDAQSAALAARLGGGQLARARGLAGERRLLREAFVGAATRVDGTGGTCARLAEELDGAVKDAIAALKARHEQELAEFDMAAERAGYPPRAVAAQRRRMLTRHDRHERIARREALVEGVTALETVYRDALAGPEAPHRNLDRDPLAIETRAGVRALEACRDARQSLEHNPNEGLLLARLLLHLPAVATTPDR